MSDAAASTGSARAGEAASIDTTREPPRTDASTLDPQDRLSLLASATRSIIWNAGPNGELLGEQPGWTAFTGQTSANLQRFGWADSVHPDDRERAAAAWARALEVAEPAPSEFRLRRADDEYRDVLSRLVAVRGPDGSLREWIGVTTDLTERRSLEARALTDAERLRVTLSSIGDGVITTDAAGLVEILKPGRGSPDRLDAGGRRRRQPRAGLRHSQRVVARARR